MKDQVRNISSDLASFIKASPTAFHSVLELENRFQSKGFVKLDEKEKWSLKKGGLYYITRNNSSLISFILGNGKCGDEGFRISGAHTDSPSLKIKNSGASVVGGILRVSVEPYGGAINSTWLDRNLSIAGKVVTTEGIKFIDLKQPVAIVMNQAIHMNRELNKGFEYNKQKHLQAALTVVDPETEKKPAQLFQELIAEKSNIELEAILDMELFLYDVQEPLINGMNDDFISSARIDNLAMCHAVSEALIEGKDKEYTSIGLFFDNEEIGSRTLQGADSSFFRDTLERINMATGGDLEDSYRARARSFAISADGAHAHHPNFPESHDPDYAPKLNGGPVIKISSTYRYSTTSDTASIFRKLCLKENVPYQELINRSDIPSGSTIGTMSAALTGIPSVDVGSPMFAMHSIRETAGTADHFYMLKVLKRFYNCDLNNL